MSRRRQPNVARIRLQALIPKFLENKEQQRWELAAAQGEQLIKLAARLNEQELIELLKIETARCLLFWNSGEIDSRTSRSKALLQEVLDADPSATKRAEAHCLIGWAEGISNGDPSTNNEKALLSLKRAEEAIDGIEGPEADKIRADIRTNRSHGALMTDSGDADEKRDLALEDAEAGLAERDIGEDPDAWAISQINLGSARENLFYAGELEVTKVTESYEKVRENVEVLPSAWLASLAILGSTRVLHHCLAHGTHPYEVRSSILAGMEMLCLEGLNYVSEDEPEILGRLLRRLGEINRDMGDLDIACDYLNASLEVLSLDWPSRRLRAAKCLAWVMEEKEDWEGAVEAYRLAIEASELSFDSRVQSLGRQVEARSAGKIYRWASGLMVKLGLLEEAAITLEKGLAREIGLRSRLSDLKNVEMPGVPDELVEELRRHAKEMNKGGLREGSSGAAASFYECRKRIRKVPGYERFGVPVTIEDLDEAVEPGWPIVFVNPVPSGTSILSYDGDTFRGTFLTDITSAEIEIFLNEGDPTQGSISYIGHASASKKSAGNLRMALDLVLPWLGEKVFRPLVEFMELEGVVGLSLVSCGWLPLVPLHAVRIPGGEEDQRLIDLFPTRCSPSAKMLATSLSRSTSEPSDFSLIAVASPHGNLPVSVAEARAARRSVEEGEIVIGTDATAPYFLEEAPKADLIHIGCHAEASLREVDETGIELNDRVLFANEVIAMELKARIAVASACQTAIPEKIAASDEAFSFATCLMGAGAKCVIASHWRVHDVAAGVLMVRFYSNPQCLTNPIGSLRDAQLWMRDLDDEQLDAFLADHPELKEEIQQVSDSSAAKGFTSVFDAEWISHPHKWAGFTAYGS